MFAKWLEDVTEDDDRGSIVAVCECCNTTIYEADDCDLYNIEDTIVCQECIQDFINERKMTR